MSEDYVEFLVEKLYSPATICQKLRLAYASDADEMYVLHEGRDDKHFYAEILKRINKKTKFAFFSCGNRSGVLKARNYIQPLDQFSPKRIMYMIDRDYDEVLAVSAHIPNDVFVTDYYSIESYFVGSECIEKMLRHAIGIPAYNGSIERIQGEIEQTIHEFAASVRAMSACIIAHKAKGGAVEQDSVSIDKCFSFKNCCVGHKIKGSRAAALRCLGLTVSLREWRIWYKTLLSNDPRYWVRGKLFLWLLRKVLSRAVEAARSLIDPNREQFSFSIAPLQGHGIYLFAGQYVDIPLSLIRYVRKTRAHRTRK